MEAGGDAECGINIRGEILVVAPRGAVVLILIHNHNPQIQIHTAARVNGSWFG
jgi:hypothetical protein